MVIVLHKNEWNLFIFTVLSTVLFCFEHAFSPLQFDSLHGTEPLIILREQVALSPLQVLLLLFAQDWLLIIVRVKV